LIHSNSTGPVREDLMGGSLKGEMRNQLLAAEPFMRSRQLLSYSRISQHVMEPPRFITVFTKALHWSLY
jgi:hypothetical protein